MALTRVFLKGQALNDEQISAVIEQHVETVEALKAQRDEFKAEAEKVKALEKKIEELESDGGSYKQKYEDEHSAFEAYKAEQEAKETKLNKTKAYKDLLKEAGVSEKLVDLVAKASAEEIEALELDENGAIKTADELKNVIATKYADYIKQESGSGAPTPNPENDPAGGFETMTLSRKMAYANDHPEAPEVKAWLNKN